ncbi:MAG TPA: ABC-type transport auxiliary lipoprotein family protein [Candidatus Paceibacterota bacterium]|nr:ABC-type transport auxiliary lipoprotein family protein [Verrucomicrobiota bacterium]HRY46763.1 ABC-type transport auxiliary lipoprotein family protein [Candidatus Paceibacterota bacterium]HSA00878.1 ABC-type transport auxiliary lipoprotein family protein [Candidatus Paceibacterota bacterium]
MQQFISLFLGGMLILACGCKMTRPSPIRHQFSLSIQNAAPSNTSSGNVTLQVRPLRIASPFDQKSFVYRFEDQKFEVDYYHEFVTQPALLLTDIIRQRLDTGASFKTVLSPTSLIEPDYFLEGQATELAGDFRDKTRPQAVMAIQFWLIENQTKPPRLVWRQNYRCSIPLPGPSPEALVGGWNQALDQLLDRMATDLRAQIAP